MPPRGGRVFLNQSKAESHMRQLLTLCLGLCLIALQVILGLKAFYPEAFADKTDVVDVLVQEKKPLLDQLSPGELAWLTQHPVVIIGADPNFYPLEMFDERGRYTGLGGDYLRLLRKLTGLEFRVPRVRDWATVEQLARQNHIDMFMAIAKTGRRDEYMVFTEPYVNMPGIIMTRRGSGLDKIGIEDLKGKKVAVVNNYSWHDFLREFHPEIIPVPAADTLEALQRVVTGEADAIIDYEFNLMEKIQTGGIMQIQPAGKVNSSYGHAIAVRKDWPELFSVISTALSQITPEERRILAQKWLHQQDRPAGQERRLQWIFFFVVESILLCLGLSWLWQSQMEKAVARRTRELKARLAAAGRA